eukprot:3459_1
MGCCGSTSIAETPETPKEPPKSPEQKQMELQQEMDELRHRQSVGWKETPRGPPRAHDPQAANEVCNQLTGMGYNEHQCKQAIKYNRHLDLLQLIEWMESHPMSEEEIHNANIDVICSMLKEENISCHRLQAIHALDQLQMATDGDVMGSAVQYIKENRNAFQYLDVTAKEDYMLKDQILIASVQSVAHKRQKSLEWDNTKPLLVAELRSMGFLQLQATNAINSDTVHDRKSAIKWIMTHGLTAEQELNAKMDEIVHFGFSREEAQAALNKFGNSLDHSIIWLNQGKPHKINHYLYHVKTQKNIVLHNESVFKLAQEINFDNPYQKWSVWENGLIKNFQCNKLCVIKAIHSKKMPRVQSKPEQKEDHKQNEEPEPEPQPEPEPEVQPIEEPQPEPDTEPEPVAQPPIIVKADATIEAVKTEDTESIVDFFNSDKDDTNAKEIEEIQPLIQPKDDDINPFLSECEEEENDADNPFATDEDDDNAEDAPQDIEDGDNPFDIPPMEESIDAPEDIVISPMELEESIDLIEPEEKEKQNEPQDIDIDFEIPPMDVETSEPQDAENAPKDIDEVDDLLQFSLSNDGVEDGFWAENNTKTEQKATQNEIENENEAMDSNGAIESDIAKAIQEDGADKKDVIDSGDAVIDDEATKKTEEPQMDLNEEIPNSDVVKDEIAQDVITEKKEPADEEGLEGAPNDAESSDENADANFADFEEESIDDGKEDEIRYELCVVSEMVLMCNDDRKIEYLQNWIIDNEERTIKMDISAHKKEKEEDENDMLSAKSMSPFDTNRSMSPFASSGSLREDAGCYLYLVNRENKFVLETHFHDYDMQQRWCVLSKIEIQELNPKELAKELDDPDAECIICFDRDPCVVLNPCGHKQFCKECIDELKPEECPICRTKVKSVLQQ